MPQKVLVCHGLSVPLTEIYEYAGWEVKATQFDELLEELFTGDYQALIIDVLGPERFDGSGRFDDIDRHESRDGECMAYVLALRLRKIFPRLPIVIVGDAAHHGGKDGAQLVVKCEEQSVHVIELSNVGYTIEILNGEMDAMEHKEVVQ